MKFSTLTEAIADAARFIKIAEKVRDMHLKITNSDKEHYWIAAESNRDTAAMRRASMDLTRKLSDLRQGR